MPVIVYQLWSFIAPAFDAKDQKVMSRLVVFATLLFVTGNPSKLVEARRLAAVAGQMLEAIALDLPEIQSLDLEAVLEAKGAEAFRQLGRAVVVEETGLAISGLNGLVTRNAGSARSPVNSRSG